MDALETGLEWLSHKIIGNNLIQEFATGNMFITANNNIRNVKGCVFPPSAPQLPVNAYYVHYILRDYYRQDGKVKHRTIANLSSCSSAEIQAIQIRAGISPAVAGHKRHDAGRLGGTQNALHDGIADSRPAAV